MAYYEFTYQNGYDALKRIITALADNWEFVGFANLFRGSDTNGFLQYKQLEDNLGDVTANVEYDLQAPLVFEETVTDANGTQITDYTIDRVRGKIKFNSNHSDVKVSYKFIPKSLVFNLKPFNGQLTFKIGVGIAVFDTEDNFYIVFTRYDEGLDAPVSKANVGVAFWAQTGKGFVFISENRAIVVVESEGKYSQAYGGVYIPLVNAEQLCVPYVSLGSHYCNPSYKSYCDTHSATNDYVRSLKNARGELIRIDTCDIIDFSGTAPDYLPDCNSDDTIRYEDGVERVLIPLIVYRDFPLGLLENVYWVPDANLTGETVITVNGEDYVVFPDVFRTNWCQFIAIKKA